MQTKSSLEKIKKYIFWKMSKVETQVHIQVTLFKLPLTPLSIEIEIHYSNRNTLFLYKYTMPLQRGIRPPSLAFINDFPTSRCLYPQHHSLISSYIALHNTCIKHRHLYITFIVLSNLQNSQNYLYSEHRVRPKPLYRFEQGVRIDNYFFNIFNRNNYLYSNSLL